MLDVLRGIIYILVLFRLAVYSTVKE
jgi:hypothetical protein